MATADSLEALRAEIATTTQQAGAKGLGFRVWDLGLRSCVIIHQQFQEATPGRIGGVKSNIQEIPVVDTKNPA